MRILAVLEIVLMCWIAGCLAWSTWKLFCIWMVMP